jgi:hypothetical protein
MRSLNYRTALTGVGGLLVWFLAQLFAFGLGLAGDGWLGPFFLTLPLLLLYPFVTVRFFASEARPTKLDWAALYTAVPLDLLLLLNGGIQERTYFLKVWHLGADAVVMWAVLWLGWQVLAVATLFKNANAARES